MKCRVRRNDNGTLDMRASYRYQNALPGDLYLKLREDKALEDQNDGRKQMRQTSPIRDSASRLPTFFTIASRLS